MIKNPNTNSRVGFISGSKDVYECQIQLDVVPPEPLPADAGDIARDLGAGFLRSTLGVGVVHGVDLDRLPACDQVGQLKSWLSLPTKSTPIPMLFGATPTLGSRFRFVEQDRTKTWNRSRALL